MLLQGCRPAYSFASALTGSINLIALLVAPLLSFVHQSPTRVLSFTAGLGTIAFLVLGKNVFSAQDSDPRKGRTWVAALGIGVAQIAAVVLSLSIVSAARKRLLEGEQAAPPALNQSQTPEEEEEAGEEANDKEEIAGALAGAYSFCGGELPH